MKRKAGLRQTVRKRLRRRRRRRCGDEVRQEQKKNEVPRYVVMDAAAVQPGIDLAMAVCQQASQRERK